MTALTYAPDGGGMLRPLWDTRIARLINGKTPDLWSLFGGTVHVPLLLVWGRQATSCCRPRSLACVGCIPTCVWYRCLASAMPRR